MAEVITEGEARALVRDYIFVINNSELENYGIFGVDVLVLKDDKGKYTIFLRSTFLDVFQNDYNEASRLVIFNKLRDQGNVYPILRKFAEGELRPFLPEGFRQRNDYNPPTIDNGLGSGGGGGGGDSGSGGGGGGTQETEAEKKAREAAEAAAKKAAEEKAALEKAEKAEQATEILQKLKSQPDSDQCKISRLYTPLQWFYYNYSTNNGNEYFYNPALLYFEKTNELAQDQNLTRNNPSDMDMFYLDNHKYSAFIPSVEFYKVIRQKEANSPIGKIKDIVHIAFPSTGKVTDQIIANGKTSSQLENDNIGVKSVNWHFDGTDRYTADKYVSAEVVLIAENFDSLFVKRTNLGYSYGPLGKTGTPTNPTQYAIADLLYRPGCIDLPESSQAPGAQPDTQAYSSDLTNEYKPECFEILLTAGYEISNNAATNLSINQTAAKKLKTTLFLTLRDHKFDFKENGSVEITIRYVGRMESMLKSPAAETTIGTENLYVSEQLRTQFGEIARIDGLPENIKKQFSRYAPDASIASGQISNYAEVKFSELLAEVNRISGEIGKPSTTSQDKINSAKREAKAKLEQIKLLIDQEVVLGFFASVSKEMVDNGVVFDLVLTPGSSVTKEMQRYLDSPTATNLGKLNRTFAKAVGMSFNEVGLGQSTTDVPPAGIGGLVERSTAVAIVSARQAETAETDGSSPAESSDTESDESNNTLPKRISFVFLGDLIDSIATTANSKICSINNLSGNIFENIKIVFSNTKLPDLCRMNDGEVPLSLHNIAALPISFSTLRSFANNKISNGKRSYSFLHLLKDLLNFVLPEALGFQCSQNQYMPSVRTNLYSYTSYNKLDTGYTSYALNVTRATIPGEGQDTLTGGATVGGGVSLKSVLPQFKDEYDHEDYIRNNAFNVTEMLLIYIENTDYSGNTTGFSLEQDKNKGIPWYIFGYDKGIFKKAQLIKMDQPFVLEARFRENRNAYLNQFSNMYKATIEMVGNNLLSVGGYIWLDFTGISPGLGDPKNRGSTSYFMGLGGLYLIIDIKSNMSPGKYTTTVEARFVSRGVSSDSVDPGATTVLTGAPSAAGGATAAAIVPAAVPAPAPASAAGAETAVTAINAAPPPEPTPAAPVATRARGSDAELEDKPAEPIVIKRELTGFEEP